MVTPRPITETEFLLVSSLRNNLADMHLDKDYLEDKNLIRFIRARNGNLTNAEVMARNNAQWISDYDADSLLEWVPPPILKEKIPYKIIGHDQYGGAVVITYAGLWDPVDVQKLQQDEVVRYVMQYLEVLVTSSKSKGKEKSYIPQVNIIMDLSGLSLRHYLCAKMMQAAMNSFSLMEANYPEYLGIGFYLNGPPTFGVIWNLVKPFLSPVTKEKLNFFTCNDREKARAAVIKFYKGVISNSALDEIIALVK